MPGRGLGALSWPPLSRGSVPPFAAWADGRFPGSGVTGLVVPASVPPPPGPSAGLGSHAGYPEPANAARSGPELSSCSRRRLAGFRSVSAFAEDFPGRAVVSTAPQASGLARLQSLYSAPESRRLLQGDSPVMDGIREQKGDLGSGTLSLENG